MVNNKVVSCSLEKMLPDGTYRGTWAGYTVKVTARDGVYTLNTTSGIRGSVAVKVTVIDGVPTISDW